MIDAERRIVNNLLDRVYAVNMRTAVRGVKDDVAGLRALDRLVDEKIIIREEIELPDGGHIYMYKYDRWRPALHQGPLKSVK